MRGLRKITGGVVLLAISLSNTGLASMAIPRTKPAVKPNGSLCPRHAKSCCCPELCNPPKIVKVESGCHHSQQPKLKDRSIPTIPASPCFLKAGCGTKNGASSLLTVLKDFLPVPLNEAGTELESAFYTPAGESSHTPECYSRPFHPPRLSSRV